MCTVVYFERGSQSLLRAITRNGRLGGIRACVEGGREGGVREGAIVQQHHHAHGMAAPLFDKVRERRRGRRGVEHRTA